MADLDFQSFFDWEKEIRGNYPEAPEFTEKDARLEWGRISRKREYVEILDALEDSVEDVTEFERRKGDFLQSAKQAGLTGLDRLRKQEGLVQAALQSYRTLRENLRQFTLLLIQTNKDDKVVSREWSQRYAADMLEAVRRATHDYQNIIERCQAARKQFGSLGAPVEPLPDPFGDDDVEMGDGEYVDTEMDMGEGASSEDDWEFVRVLGEGSFGKVSLWVRYDETGKVVDRCATKEGPVADEDDRNDGFMREASMHAKISAKDPDGRHIVIHRGEDFFYEDRVHRIYLEYCRYGDMWDVKRRLFDRRDKTRRQMAIPMLWALFESLARAEYLMAFGVFPNASPAKGWDRMIHRDIKPENTFLSEPPPDRWPGVPSMKMGDFGLAALESEPRLQTSYAGTAQYISPEITHVRHFTLPKDVVISTPADVWSIGATMVDLMNLGTEREESAEFYSWTKDKSYLPKVDPAGRRFYPTVLVDFVEMCLHPEPDERIEIARLCKVIDKEVRKLSTAQLSNEDRLRFPIEDEERGKIVKLEL